MKMASLILFNAGVFYEELASEGSLDTIVPIERLKVLGILPLSNVIDAWNNVLKYNYSPIFRSAVSILKMLPSDIGGDILNYMSKAISGIMASTTSKSGHVYGMLYQKLLADRKDAGAYYTKPEAATLLATLAMPPGADYIWKKKDVIKNLKIADFACGSGMLLTAAYQHVINCYSGDSRSVHKHMLEECLHGCDIMPTATHLTVSALASAYPDVMIGRSRIHTLRIGSFNVGGSGKSYDLGSLDLIKNDSSITASGVRVGGKGEEDVHDMGLSANSCDYVLMNPPFKTLGSTGGRTGMTQSPFSVFGISENDQEKMRNHTSILYKGTSASSLAGLGSHFIVIANKMLKVGGVMAVILPGSFIAGSVWKNTRSMLDMWYDDVIVVIVGTALRKVTKNSTLSAETGMNESVIVARKRLTPRNNGDESRVKLVLLNKTPDSRIEAVEIAKLINKTPAPALEDGMGPSSLLLGDELVGKIVSCPTENGTWHIARTSNVRLLQISHNLFQNRTDISISQLDDFIRVGKIRKDIVGGVEHNKLRGPFKQIPFSNDAHPCLWKNNAEIQQSLSVNPDSSLEKKSEATLEHAQNVLQTASRVHINQQCRYTSQKLIAAWTQEPTIGGGGWLNITLQNATYEKTIMIWYNSTFGILSYWSVAGSQQHGRGRMNNAKIKSLPIINLNKLTKKQIREFDKLFDELCYKKMLPINHLDVDHIRQKLDYGIIKILGITPDVPLDSLRKMIAADSQFGRM